MTEQPMRDEVDTPDVAWYAITIAGKQFNVSSRYGEAHIREVERLLTETHDLVHSRVDGQSALHVALLTALNLADQVLMLKRDKAGMGIEAGQRLESLVVRLDSILGSRQRNPGDLHQD